MNKPDEPAGAVEHVQARCISTQDATQRPAEERVGVAVETPVTIDVEGVDTFTVLCTPGENRAMALGFLFSEGIIDGIADVGVLRECDEDPDTIRVRLTPQAPRRGVPGRNLLIVSSCGACGSEELRARIEALPPVEDPGLDDRDERIRVLTERFTAVFEREIAAAPAQWAWMHERWATTPEKLARRRARRARRQAQVTRKRMRGAGRW